MKIVSLLIVLLLITKTSLAFNFKDLGDAIQKDLGGALGTLEKSLIQKPDSTGTLNDSKSKKENTESSEAEKKRKLAIEERRKSAKKRELAIEERRKSAKKNAGPRRIWGVNFNDSKAELKSKGCIYLRTDDSFLCGKGDKTSNVKLWDGYPWTIYKLLGKHTYAGFKKWRGKLQKKYNKPIISPTAVEKEKFIRGRGKITYYYKNTKKGSKRPLYIYLQTESIPKWPTTMQIGYYSKRFFEKVILKEMKKKKEKEDDF